MNSYEEILQSITELYDQNKLDFNNYKLLKKELESIENIHKQQQSEYRSYFGMLEKKINNIVVSDGGLTENQVQNIVSNYVTSHKSELKGDKGDKGETGAKGSDGLTTRIKVNGTTYTQSNGLITLPDYPSGDNTGSGTEVNPVYSILRYKKWVVIGDSISDVTLGHTPKHYQEIISEKTGCTLFNWGGNGTGYFKEFNGVSYIYNRINEIPEDADLITIFAGTNDNLNVGNYGDTGFTSFYGAVDKTVSAIKEKFPLVPLGLITPLPRTVNDLTNAKNKNYSDVIIEIGKKYSVPVFDMYANCGFNVNNADFKLNCLTDGLHPNINGHTIMAQKLKPWLEDVVLTSNYYKIIVRGLAVFNSDNLNFTSGETKTFTMGLNRVPNENQGVLLQSTNTSVTISPSTIYFNKTAEAKTITLTIPSSVTASFTINAVSWNTNIGSITFSNNGSSSGGDGGESEVTLSSITAEYTQGSTAVYPTTSLDSLKNNLVVKANYSDNSQATLNSSDYSLSGTLSVGPSTITVTYSDKSATFTVNVIEEPEIVEELTEADYLIKINFSDTSQSGKLVDSSGNNNNLNLKNTSANVLSNGELVVNNKTNCGTNLTTLSTPFEGDSYSVEFAYKQEQDNGSTLIYSQDGAINVSENGNSSIRCGVRGYSSEGSTTVWGTQEDTQFTSGIYNHFVFTITKTNIKLYVNGVLSKTSNITSTIDRFIINSLQILSYNFKGSVNTFNIIKKEITSSQVNTLYTNWHNQ